MQNSKRQVNSTRWPTCYLLTWLSLLSLAIVIHLVSCQPTTTSEAASSTATTASQQKQQVSFPGVSRDLTSFCAARPSLPIDLALMVVHVKKNVSFNFKLYLFSTDHVFQTGQVIPRDDFRIHSFPVKLKRLQEFWPATVDTYLQSGDTQLKQVSSSQFNLKQFLRPVALNPAHPAESRSKSEPAPAKASKKKRKHRTSKAISKPPPEDAHLSALPGDPEFTAGAAYHTVSGEEQLDNFNKHIQFDRDDQLSVVRRVNYLPESSEPAPKASALSGAGSMRADDDKHREPSSAKFYEDLVTPVGSFSSFHVNVSYLVRKDFDQTVPQLIRVLVDANQFQVVQVHLIGNKTNPNEDYSFLSHKVLRDPNTRITAINQIYEDWITRNFYTVVYIQRRLDAEDSSTGSLIVTDRLVFRGASISLLGADQLDYNVKAAAFITEKNGLHYYLEFLNTGKFYLCAVDWTKRPFKIIDSRRFPIKATRTQLDNEELLLCPPAACYSHQPIDELIGYGRVALSDKTQQETLTLSASLSSSAGSELSFVATATTSSAEPLNETALVYSKKNASDSTVLAERLLRDTLGPHQNKNGAMISLDAIVDAIKLGAGQIQTKLHLRDWIWILPRSNNNRPPESTEPDNLPSGWPKFQWHYEQAKRNDIKVKPDTYGYVLTGHEIDASYRVYNELYLISADHLITINYTLANETVTSSHPLTDEFAGLSSTLIDPITGAFYDRYLNQIFFFKGDRYIGFDYATKKPLEDFLLQTPDELQESISGPLVSSLPVVGILGRQHQVDAIYHDFASDLVFIISGMKFYTFLASEFKSGSFKPESGSLPTMYCINERLFEGCHFDQAYPNPCQPDPVSEVMKIATGDDMNETTATGEGEVENVNSTSQRDPMTMSDGLDFSEEQQMKLRSIASKAGLLDLLVEKTITSKKVEHQLAADNQLNEMGDTMAKKYQEKIMVYLLMAMVVLTVLVTIVMIVIVLNWSRFKAGTDSATASGQQPLPGNNYLANQQQHQQRLTRHNNHLVGPALPPRNPTSTVDQNRHVSHHRQRAQPKSLGPVSVVVSKGRRSSQVDNSAL